MSRRKYVLLLGFLIFIIAVLYPVFRWPGIEVRRPGEMTFVPLPEQQIDGDTLPQTLHVTVSVDPKELTALEQASQRFVEEHPQITVTIHNMPSVDAYHEMERQAGLGDLSDIVLMDNMWVSRFASRGYLKPTDAVFAAGSIADQMKGLLQPLKWNGYLWGVPKDADPLVVVWSDMLLQKAGYEKPPERWVEFSELIEALGEREPALFEQMRWVNLEGGDARQLMVWLSAMNGLPEDPLELGPLSADSQKRLAYIDSSADLISAWGEEQDKGRLERDLSQGFLLSAVVPWSKLRPMMKQLKDAVQISETLDKPVWHAGRSFVISSHTKAEEEARAWIETVTAPDNQQRFYEAFGKLPVLQSLYGATPYGLNAEQAPSWLLERFNAEPEWKFNPEWFTRYNHYSALWRQWRAGEIEREAFVRAWNEAT
ncbi:extracellular solute-binding protein [Paenibacillaceae bacterium]|nr:extracellular solute-binding protein [Paenibacillaceae bacterium]